VCGGSDRRAEFGRDRLYCLKEKVVLAGEVMADQAA
jgi:hypothetical protein